MNLKEVAYEKFKFYWMMTHDIKISDFNRIATIWKEDYEEPATMEAVIEEIGFRGMIWPGFGEFLDCEFQDEDLMEKILTKTEFCQYKIEILKEGN